LQNPAQNCLKSWSIPEIPPAHKPILIA